MAVKSTRNSRIRAFSLMGGVIAVSAALALAGCTPTSSGGSAGNGDTITVWHYFSDENQVKVMTDYKDLFEKNNDGVTVENVFVPYDQLNSKLITAVGSKTGPDVVVFNGADASTLALGGALAPMTKQWGAFTDKDQFPEAVVHSLDNDVYAVQGYVNLLGLWYNQDILDEVGIVPPTTMDELNAALTAVTAAGKDGITLSGLPQSQGEWQAYPWLSSFGFNYDKPEAAPLEAAFTMLQSWTGSGALTREAVTWDQTVPFQTWAAGNVAFAQNGNWQLGTARSDAGFNYGVVPLPVGDSGQVYLGGEGQSIGAFSANPELAWDYLEQTYFSEEGQAIALSGVGSIPSRLDAASAPEVTEDPILAAFAQSIEENGANYPARAVPAVSVADQQLVVGQIWSAVIGGQMTPSEAATKLVTDLEQLLAQ
ncbi:sugar ABC transporter substrate-binding protein [Cryobacterium sp. Hh7]|uniref:sugar ABC transporter substrate-binding protein n=1 Tax=Cryobacterium sp. Hh7 TaxID=1259159 RepID=UPI00106B54FC|nr:sugar ABC transporter substrate-binding protein [Cryobacterium sp. Hh7]TFD54169.1 sugar ABC transporter substrate-binding protein [Cryobacterium sp. Hh7]